VKVPLALFAAGTLLLVPFEYTVTLVAGVLLLVAWIVVGAFAVLSPERLNDGD
jgi:hypothetical protein